MIVLPGPPSGYTPTPDCPLLGLSSLQLSLALLSDGPASPGDCLCIFLTFRAFNESFQQMAQLMIEFRAWPRDPRICSEARKG